MKKEHDPIGYEDVIRAAFPNALIKYVGNFDDINYGWEICPHPGHFILFKVQMGNDMNINITALIVKSEKELRCKTVFNGCVPGDKNSEPDFDFIEQLLKNYQSIG